MTVTVTNETKNGAVVSGENRYGVANWDDPLVAWDSPLFTWDNLSLTITNETKNNAVISNENKS